MKTAVMRQVCPPKHPRWKASKRLTVHRDAGGADGSLGWRKKSTHSATENNTNTEMTTRSGHRRMFWERREGRRLRCGGERNGWQIGGIFKLHGRDGSTYPDG